MVSDDRLSAALAEFRERREKRADFSRHIEATFVREAAETDVRRLLAALDAVLKFHQPIEGDWGTTMCSCWVRGGSRAVWPCKEVIAIAGELLGGD